jgi:large subunit ribosomal protein L23
MEKLTNNIGDLLSLIKYPLITEKSTSLSSNKQYTFIVDKSLTKIEIKLLIEKIFNVKVIKIGTMILPTKTKRVGKFIGKKATYKKTYIRLKEGDFINDLFE